jgi:hypothetical protein
MLEPVRRAGAELEAYIADKPKRSIGGVILVGLLIAFGIWVWPEVHRTIRIHRM